MAEGGTPKLDLQKKEIFDLLKTSLKKGDTWYLIDSKWFKQWKKYVGFDSWDMFNLGQDTAFPGPVDNSQLLKSDGNQTLKDNLIDDLDYVLVSAEAWNKLVLWYDLVESQEAIARKVVEHGMFVKHCKVEVYLMELKLCKNSNPTNCVSKQFSKADTIETIEHVMRDAFNISDKTEIRIWNKYMSNTYEQLAKKDNTVQDAGLYQGQVLVVEQKNDDGSWPRQATLTNSYTSSLSSSNRSSSSSGSSSRSSSGYSSNTSYDYGGSRGIAKPGLCGLSNLGNTCFMNAAFQCMSNVPPLTRYFVVNKHEQELNEDNPLGMKGEIARAYAELIKQMWCGRYKYTVPRNFKMQVGRFAPQFSGYQQQDSQELLGFLLDGLHEDLNRIKKKPYIELKEGDGRPDHEVSKEAWDNHLRRNNSIIVDIFHGLFKSTLDCPTCHKRSVTFDPFCFLTLPLPLNKERVLEVFVIRMDPEWKPVQMKVTVPKQGLVSDLCKAISEVTNIREDMMVVTDVYNHRFHKVFAMDNRIEIILDRDDIFVYEVPVNTSDDRDVVILPVYLREKGNSYYSTSGGTSLFGQPMLIPVKRQNTTYQDLYDIIANKMSRYVEQPLNDDWCIENGKEDQQEWEDNQNNHQENGEMDSTSDNEENRDYINEEGIRTADETKDEERNGIDFEKKDVESNDNSKRLKPIFSMVLVNSYGSTDIAKVQNDGKPVVFTNRTYIALDWVLEAKRLFYLSEEADAIEKHESMKNSTRKKPVIQLDDCIRLFLTKEQLGKDDLWYCPECKEHRQAYKKFDLWKLPKILVINLKRFSYNRYWRDKLDTPVVYPVENLNIKEHVINEEGGPYVYDLLGVVNHYGGLGGGHYTAYAKNIEDQQWYNFDDSSVAAVDKDHVVSKAGYVLFYMRKDPDDARHRRVSASLASPEEDDEGNVPDRSTNNRDSDKEEGEDLEDMETDPS